MSVMDSKQGIHRASVPSTCILAASRFSQYIQIMITSKLVMLDYIAPCMPANDPYDTTIGSIAHYADHYIHDSLLARVWRIGAT